MKTTYNRNVVNVLANFEPNSGASDDYCRGVIVAVFSGIMDSGKSFEATARIVMDMMPLKCRRLTSANVPPTWLCLLK